VWVFYTFLSQGEVENFAFQSTAHIGLLKDSQGRRQWQIVENCPGQIRNLPRVEVFIGRFV
jgi:hypothetical protein